MRLRVLLIAVISTAWAQTKNVERPVRAPQQQIKYDNIDGSRVSLAPENQWRSHLVNIQRSQRAEGGSPQRPRQAQQAPQQHAPQQQAPQSQLQRLQPAELAQKYYRPYSSVPSHIKQLIEQTYQPQPPYVDPTSFLYNSYVTPQQPEQQPAPAASEVPRAAYLQPSARYQSIDPQRAQSRLEYSDRRVERQNKAVYRQDYEQPQQQEQQQTHQAVLPVGIIPEPPMPTLYLDRNMPLAIKQLLQYQAQIPYDVTANRIQYTPKKVFIPKPLSDDVKGPYYYRSKVYYVNDENVDAEYPQDKPINDEQQRRH